MPAKRQQMLASASKSAGVYWRLFFRIETFQRVTGDSNKKIFPHATPCLECHNRLSTPESAGPEEHGPDFVHGKMKARDSGLRKKFSLFRIRPPPRAAPSRRARWRRRARWALTTRLAQLDRTRKPALGKWTTTSPTRSSRRRIAMCC